MVTKKNTPDADAATNEVVTETEASPKVVSYNEKVSQARAAAEHAVNTGTVDDETKEVEAERVATGRVRTGWTMDGAATFKTPKAD